MKTRIAISASLACLSVFAGSVQAQTTVATDPVGFVSTDLPATGFTYFGVNLTTPPLLVSSNTTLTGDEVDVGIDLDALDGAKKYAMEIQENDHALEGFAADIASWTGQVLTLEENLEDAGVTPASFDGARVTIREIPTIASIFGADNSAGLKAGPSVADADVIYHYSDGGFKTYFYFPGGFDPAGWQDASGNDSGSVPIHFGDGLIIETKDTNPKTISISGNVKVGPTNIPIYSGFNLISNPSPVEGNLTLGNSGLEASLQKGTTAGDSDIVYIAKPGGGFDTYYYFVGGFDPAGWKNAGTNADATNVILPNSGAFFVERRSTDTSVTLTEDLPNN